MARRPDEVGSGAAIAWYRVGELPPLGQTHVRFVDSGLGAALPRLVLVTEQGVLLSDDTEWWRQRRCALRLGRCLQRSRGIPEELWVGRVVPLLLPKLRG